MKKDWFEPTLTILDITDTQHGLPGHGDDGYVWVSSFDGSHVPGSS